MLIDRSKLTSLSARAVLVALVGCVGFAMPADAAAPALDFEMTTLDGESVDLEKEYGGKVVLMVNVASQCGFTRQYAGLQELYEEYKDDGLVVIGVPCNQFGGQEPGSAEQIAQFCDSKFGVTFPMLSKVDVNGSDAAPLYQYLTANADPSGQIRWNFEKFLIGKDGKVVARYGSSTEPDDAALVKQIETELAK